MWDGPKGEKVTTADLFLQLGDEARDQVLDHLQGILADSWQPVARCHRSPHLRGTLGQVGLTAMAQGKTSWYYNNLPTTILCGHQHGYIWPKNLKEKETNILMEWSVVVVCASSGLHQPTALQFAGAVGEQGNQPDIPSCNTQFPTIRRPYKPPLAIWVEQSWLNLGQCTLNLSDS